MTSTSTSLEWFGIMTYKQVAKAAKLCVGATTFRLKVNGLVIFLDTWLEKPSVLQTHLHIDDVDIADYILISHAHFDHLPGADRLAKRTGATVIGNCEAIHVLRKAGVREEQLLAVTGGERVPLFTKDIVNSASKNEIGIRPAPPLAPSLADPALATMAIDVWPSLHCLMPPVPHEDMPDIIDTGKVYTGAAHPYVCTFDINYGMKHGLLQIDKMVPPEHRDAGLSSFIDYINNPSNLFSAHDGGQLMYNIHVSEGKTILWNAHLGVYSGILQTMIPKPEIAILGIAGRANLNGRPFDGSAAKFAVSQVKWMDCPKQIIWCLHDQSPIRPYSIDTSAATDSVESETTSKVLHLEHNTLTYLNL